MNICPSYKICDGEGCGGHNEPHKPTGRCEERCHHPHTKSICVNAEILKRKEKLEKISICED